MRIIGAIACLCLTAACAESEPARSSTAPSSRVCPTLTVSLDADLRAHIDPILEAKAEEGFAGQVAVLDGDQIIYLGAAGHADLASEIPVTHETHFQVSSITKYLTAVLILKASEEGLIDLGDPAGTSIGDVEAIPQTYAQILAHTAGYASSYIAENYDDNALALSGILDANPEAASRAGEFRYSNDGYDLLGILVERIYRTSYEGAAQLEVLDPACVDAGFWGQVDHSDPTAFARALIEPPPALLRRNYGMLGASGLLISAQGLLQLQHAIESEAVLGATHGELIEPRAELSIGRATYGGFLVERPGLGRALSLRGYMDWGDNAYLMDYLECDLTLAIVTSRGPREDSGKSPFRDQLLEPIEAELAPFCESPA
ncbi:class C beta-lactamase-related serine hydrolase [Marinicauda algicola]|uniref:Class C beta-lactamase-related serine hydrolase n=1 Tax=Marinicauda algicola TaxID=2029849 RepID=A0A4S2H031_9PROT|nr:serine hydrolase [Marinicauda algicola]TGY88608.1 class C beta-lactamase-related serine hydrolase [Marinicauda algicola]